MLWKLLKYDFRSMWKQFAVVWPAVLVIGLVNRFTLPWEVTGSSAMANDPGAVGVTTVILLFAGLLAMGVLALVFILQRFYKGLLGDEGYLMHTLPVKPWQLVASKLICAVTMLIISGAVALENGWWQDKDGFNSSSVLTNDTIEVLGTATTINSTLVNVRKA